MTAFSETVAFCSRRVICSSFFRRCRRRFNSLRRSFEGTFLLRDLSGRFVLPVWTGHIALLMPERPTAVFGQDSPPGRRRSPPHPTAYRGGANINRTLNRKTAGPRLTIGTGSSGRVVRRSDSTGAAASALGKPLLLPSTGVAVNPWLCQRAAPGASHRLPRGSCPL